MGDWWITVSIKMAEISEVSEDSFVSEMLYSWGMPPNVVQTFKDQGIDVDIFLQLNENDAKEILKDFVLGIKLKFWKKYAEWKDTVKFEEMSAKFFTGDIFSSTKNINNKMEEREELTEVNQSETSISSEEVVELEHVSGDSDNNDLESDSENNKLLNKVGMKRKQNLAETENLTSTKKKKMVNPNIVAEKKIIAFSVSRELMDLDLKKLLGQSLEGKATLQSYEMNKCLEEEDRTALVDIVIK